MNNKSQGPESGATLLEILIASSVFIVLLILSLGTAAEFSEYGKQADADTGIQLEIHHAFSKVERILRQGWTTLTYPKQDSETEVEIRLYGYEYNTSSQSWEQIDPRTWRREQGPNGYYFTDSNENELPFTTCKIEWKRLSLDPQSDLYHFGDLTCTLTDEDGFQHTPPWVLARKIGTHEKRPDGQRMTGVEFSLNGKSIQVTMHLQRNPEDFPYSIRSKIQHRNFIESN